MSKILRLIYPIFFAYFSTSIISNPINANEVTYKLTNGNIVSGSLIEEKSSEETIVINNPIFGIIRIDKKNILFNDLDINHIEYADEFLQLEDQSNKRWSSNISVNTDSITNDGDIYNLFVEQSSNYKGDLNELEIRSRYEKNSWSEGDYSDLNETAALEIYNNFSLNEVTNLFLGFQYQYDSSHIVGQDEYLASLGIGYKLLNNPDYKLTITPAISSHVYDDGSACIIHNCGDLLYASTIISNLEWNINNNLILDVLNTYAVANGSENITINNLWAELRYYPQSISSNLYTNINYSIDYNEITDPTPDKKLGLGMGLSF